MENKKFRSIAEVLRDQGKDPHELEVVLNAGRLQPQKPLEKWDKETEDFLVQLVQKRSLSAIRRKLLRIYNTINPKPTDWGKN